jgi:hypothetical protein
MLVTVAVAMPYPEEEGQLVISPEVAGIVAEELLAQSELAEGENVDERYRPNSGHQSAGNAIRLLDNGTIYNNHRCDRSPAEQHQLPAAEQQPPATE